MDSSGEGSLSEMHSCSFVENWGTRQAEHHVAHATSSSAALAVSAGVMTVTDTGFIANNNLGRSKALFSLAHRCDCRDPSPHL